MMATVAAIFDDSVALENAINKLQAAGLGGDVSRVEEEREADVAPEQTSTGDVAGEGAVVPPLVGGAGLGGTGTGAGGVGQTQGSPGILAGMSGSAGSNNLDRLGDDAQAFELAVSRGGKLIVLETDDPDKAVSVLREAGAQQLHDPR